MLNLCDLNTMNQNHIKKQNNHNQTLTIEDVK